MGIVHPEHPAFPSDPTLGGAVMFAKLLGYSCSICAPLIMDQQEVEAAAMIMLKPARGPWRCVDKSQPPISIPGKTPSPCNQYADRQHWFLISEGTVG